MRNSQLWRIPEGADYGGIDARGADIFFPCTDQRLCSSSSRCISAPVPASFLQEEAAGSFASPRLFRSSNSPRSPAAAAAATAGPAAFPAAAAGTLTPFPAAAAAAGGDPWRNATDGRRGRGGGLPALGDGGWMPGSAATADLPWQKQRSLWKAFFKQCCLWPPLQVVGCMYTACACLACAIAAQQLPLSRAADVTFPTVVSVAAFLGCLVCRSFLLTPPSQALKAAAAAAEGPAAAPLLVFTSRKALPLLLAAAVLHAAAAIAASTLLLHLLLPMRPSLEPLTSSFELFFVYPFAIVTALLHAYRFAVRRRWLLVLSSAEVPDRPILLPHFFVAAAVEAAAALLLTLLLLPLLVPAAAAAAAPTSAGPSGGRSSSSTTTASVVSSGSSRARRPRVYATSAAAEVPSAAVVFSSVYASLSPLFSGTLLSRGSLGVSAAATTSRSNSSTPHSFASEEQHLHSRRRRKKTKGESGYASSFIRWLQLLLTLVIFVPRYCFAASSALALLLLSSLSSFFLLAACVCSCCFVQAFLLLLLNVHQELQRQTSPAACSAVTAACAQAALGGAWPSPTAAAGWPACCAPPAPRLSSLQEASASSSPLPLWPLWSSCSNVFARFSPPRTGALFDQQCLMLRWLHDCGSALQLWWDVGYSNNSSSAAAAAALKVSDYCCCCGSSSAASYSSSRPDVPALDEECRCNTRIRCIDASTFFSFSPCCCCCSPSVLQQQLFRSSRSSTACVQWHQKGIVASATGRERLPLTYALLEYFTPAAARSGFPLSPIALPFLRRSSRRSWWWAPAAVQEDYSRAAAALQQQQQQQQQKWLEVCDSSTTSLTMAAAVVTQQMLSQQHQQLRRDLGVACLPPTSLFAAYEAVVRGALLHYMRLLRTLQQLQQGLFPFPSASGGWKHPQQQVFRESAAAAATIEAAKAEAAADAAAAAAASAAAEAGRAAAELRRRRRHWRTSARDGEEGLAAREMEKEHLQQRAAAAAGAAAAAALSAAAAPALPVQRPWWLSWLPTKVLLLLQQTPLTNSVLRRACSSNSRSRSSRSSGSSANSTVRESSSSTLLTSSFGVSGSGATAAAAVDASKKTATGCWWMMKSLLWGEDNYNNGSDSDSSSGKGFWESRSGAALQLEICMMAGVCACAVEGLAMWLCAAVAAAKEEAAAADQEQQLAATAAGGQAQAVSRSNNCTACSRFEKLAANSQHIRRFLSLSALRSSCVTASAETRGLTAAGTSARLGSGCCEAAAKLAMTIAEVLQHELRVRRNATVAANAASATLREEVWRAMDQFTRRGKKATILMRRYEPLRLYSLCTGGTAAKTRASLSPQAFDILCQLLSLPCRSSPL